ncbi:methyltransferase type 11 [Tianweitania sp. BSSL-BM11]|uniref:Methyltransferase type 11 n=1 Tax=Tianweitania aestuarii TaxID=2814886 RepID=A0ABS5RWU9_9HYPH|nr:small ribosomal subunit Rsm22 family protein [Tianweitania aestuarii]MBS9721551.1 methyltransferase type 11 [Tianweitania aestuarii]
MELPARLRQAVDAALAGVPLADLQRASERLTQRYRGEVLDGQLHLGNEVAALAYVTARLPATYAAVRAALEHTAELTPQFRPSTLMDIGSGPGTAMWASADCWPSLDQALLLDASPSIRALGSRFSTESRVTTDWRAFDIARDTLPQTSADLVTLAYVLDELTPVVQLALIDQAWARTTGMLVVVEPGTPAGWRRILAVRDRLIEAGATLVAPCPHHAACPLLEPDWCHFSRRVARSTMHRMTKRGAVPWEDEKYIYLAASRLGADQAQARVLLPPRESSGKVELKLCCADGAARERLVTRREGEVYKRARRADWGDAL